MESERITNIRLDNGMRVIGCQLKESNSMAAAISLRAGSRCDPPENPGMMHFFEHLMFLTSKPEVQEMSRAIDALGGELNAQTSKEFCTLWATVNPNFASNAFDIISAMFLSPMPGERHFEREKGIIKQEIRDDEDNVNERLSSRLDVAVFGNRHPLGMPILGTHESVSGMSRTYIKKFAKRIVTPSNIMIIFAGDFDTDGMLGMAKRNFGGMRGKPFLRRNSQPEHRSGIDPFLDSSLCSAHISIGIPYKAITQYERHVALLALDTILSDGFGSRFFRNVRERIGNVYQVTTGVNNFHGIGLFEINTSCKPRLASTIARAILAEIRDIRDNGVTENEMVFARNKLAADIATLSMDPFKMADSQIEIATYYKNPKGILTDLRIISHLNAEDLNSVARDVFAPSNPVSFVYSSPVRIGIREKDLVL